jgi:hypothetical protein
VEGRTVSEVSDEMEWWGAVVENDWIEINYVSSDCINLERGGNGARSRKGKVINTMDIV